MKLGGLTLALLWASSAAASPSDPASRPSLLSQGVALFAKGEFERSRSVLQQALRQTNQRADLARIWLHIGLNLAAENRMLLARDAFIKALHADPTLRLDPQEYKPGFVTLFAAARAALEGELAVFADRHGLQVFVDGRAAGRVPHVGRLLQGTHRVEVRAVGGSIALSRQVTIVAGKRLELEVVLGKGRNEQQRRAFGAPQERQAVTTAGRRPRRFWTWISAAGAAAILAAATGLALAARADEQEGCTLLGEQSLPCDRRDTLRSADDRARYEHLRERVAKETLAANVGWGLGAALAAGAVLLFWLEGRASAPDREERPRAAGQAVRPFCTGLPGEARAGFTVPF